MKFLFFILTLVQLTWGADATLEVVKGVEGLSPLAIEDSSPQSSEISQKFTKMLAADMNVVSLFTVDESYATAAFDSPLPSPMHKDAQYILRYRLSNDGARGIRADIKLLHNGRELFFKRELRFKTK